jgi:16S rRNA processing protein RimM
VIDQLENKIGKVIEILETGSNDVLIIQGTKKFAIPYLPHVILKIDLAKQEIRINSEMI